MNKLFTCGSYVEFKASIKVIEKWHIYLMSFALM